MPAPLPRPVRAGAWAGCSTKEPDYDVNCRSAASRRTDGFSMTHTIEISLKIPSLRIRREGKDALDTIVNTDVRFTKHVQLDVVPKPGDVLSMTVGPAGSFQCNVIRTDWRDDKDMFVTACQYARRSMVEADYQALVDDPAWQMRDLLPGV